MVRSEAAINHRSSLFACIHKESEVHQQTRVITGLRVCLPKNGEECSEECKSDYLVRGLCPFFLPASFHNLQ